MSSRFNSWIPALACVLLATAAADRQTLAGATKRADRGTHHVTCSNAVQHPIAVRVEALDEVRPGGIVRLRVNATSRISFERARVQVLDAGRGIVVGARQAAIGRLDPERSAGTEFRVMVPADGGRALVQFRVEAEGPNGRVDRGATYNLLPAGSGAPVRVVTGSGGRQVAEHAARRIN